MGVLGEDSSLKIESVKRTMMNKMIKNRIINNVMLIDVHINSFIPYNQYDGCVDSGLYTFFQEKLKRRHLIKNFYCIFRTHIGLELRSLGELHDSLDYGLCHYLHLFHGIDSEC